MARRRARAPSVRIPRPLTQLPALFFLRVALRRDARHINRDNRFVAHHPGVVPGRYHVRLAGTNLLLRAVLEPDVQPPRDLVAGVQDLTAVGPGYGLDVLRPSPAGLEHESRGVELTEGSDLHPAVLERPGLVWGVQALLLETL